MSRVGNKPIIIPKGVEVAIQGMKVTVKGPKGSQLFDFPEPIKVYTKENKIRVERPNDNFKIKALHGTVRSRINNMILGVTTGFSRKIAIHGVGYRAKAAGNKLSMTLGYTHPVEIEAPKGISFEVEKDTIVTVSGIDKQLVGQVSADIRAARQAERYLYGGKDIKGVKYLDEKIKTKLGKRGK